MVHESIHAFDACRVKLDSNNCTHLACTEIRAANLSTDCNFSTEVARGIYKLQGQQQVRARACVCVWSLLHHVCVRVCTAVCEAACGTVHRDAARVCGSGECDAVLLLAHITSVQ